MASRNGGNGRSKRLAGERAPEEGPSLQVRTRENPDSGPSAQVLLTIGGHEDIDLTRQLTSVIAHSLWLARGGDGTQNWIDAERLLDRLVGAPPKPQRTERRALSKENDHVLGPLPESAFSPGRRAPVARI